MNYIKYVFWLKMCVVLAAGQFLIGREQSSSGREFTILEIGVYSTLGKTYNIESDLADEQHTTQIALNDKPVDHLENASSASANEATTHTDSTTQPNTYEIQYAPQINDLPYVAVGASNHTAVQTRSIPLNTPAETFVESEYVPAEMDYHHTYQRAPSQNIDAVHEKGAPSTVMAPDYQSHFSLNPAPAEFYFTSNAELAPSLSPVQSESIHNPPKQLPAESNESTIAIPHSAASAADLPVQKEQLIKSQLIKAKSISEIPSKKNKAAESEIAVLEKPNDAAR